MTYKLVVTEHADALVDNIVYYLLHKLKSKQAAKHLLAGIENIYDRLEDNPQQFPFSRDAYLANNGYREAIIPEMEYILVFNIEANNVNVVGVFHQRENYYNKI
jgi:plasmid stabilization system protein ParE